MVPEASSARADASTAPAAPSGTASPDAAPPVPPAGAPARRQRTGWRLLGPAFVAAVAYVDPGNVAANLTAGAQYGYLLLWVLVLSNAMAVLVQYLSAKLGVVTGTSLAEQVGAGGGRLRRLLYWAQAELVVAATDVAEVIGGALALQILFDLPLVLGGLIVGAVSMFLLALRGRDGRRRFEVVILGMLLIIAVGFAAGLLVHPPDPGQMLGGLVPRFEGAPTVLLAASMLGATVMPHAIYLHSGLVRDTHGGGGTPERIRLLLRATRWDVALSLLLAGSINIAMLVLAAQSLRGVPGTDTIPGAQAAIAAANGPVIATLFGIGLLASGLASTSVGAHAGAAVMADLLHRRVPLLVRRLVTLAPAIVILALGVDATWALVASQVVLSLGIPFAFIPLVVITGRRRLLGAFTNLPLTRILAWTAAGLIVALNIALVVLTVSGA
ncbi:Nramp family divalent metal transporter [Brachybacterium sp. AOP25-B2-12]|uniref:Nramp family divalent metal transporter n=1 Tax=Brachybacterium sp. AOP25-B2-12 TaxID=3457710 RepID=UPI0040348662